MTQPEPDTPRSPRTRGTQPASPDPRPAARRQPTWADYLRDPRSAVLAFLATALVVGGGRRLLQAVRARRAVAALGGSNPAPEDVAAAAEFGRAGLIDLFRLLETAKRPEVRSAAGRSLARLWRLDELIAEEEKAIVRRGTIVSWHARRKYPRALSIPIPIRVDFGVPFLDDPSRSIGPEHLRWSYRLLGTQRAHLETWTEIPSGVPASASLAIVPDDFGTLGPHRLELHTRVRTVGLTANWEFELPHQAFAFEFDPHLTIAALLTLPDAGRAAQIALAVRLISPAEPAGSPLTLLALTADLVIRNPPSIRIDAPLPCDLAHRLAIEVEGVPGTFAAGSVVAIAADRTEPDALWLPLGPVAAFPPGAIDRPGPRRIRAVLTADPSLGWTEPAVRSIWPDPITTDWAEVQVIRS